MSLSNQIVGGNGRTTTPGPAPAPRPSRPDEIDRARATLEAAGFVVLREKSYRQAQERQRVAQLFREHAEEDAEHAREWARNCLTEERYLRERLTFVYGVARAHGATVEELRNPSSEALSP